MDRIISFSAKLKTMVENMNDKFIKRHNVAKTNKLDFKNTLFASALALNKSGIDGVVSSLKIHKIVDIRKNSIIKKRNNDLTHSCMKNMNDNIINMIYDPANNFIKPYNLKIDYDDRSYIDNKSQVIDTKLFINRTNVRFIACDGMQINIDKNLINNNDVKSSNNANYGVCIISTLFDVINNIPINYGVTECNENNIDKKKVNETTGFLNQLSYLLPGDIVIFDRWYYSEMLIKILNEKGIGYLFRMKSTSKFFKGMSLGKSKIVNFMGKDVQAFKYKIDKEVYYILTSITEKISIKEIKALYWKRWKNETDNKKFKYDILYDKIRSKNYNSFLVDIESIRFISLISSFVEYLGKDEIKARHKINSKNCLQVIFEKLLYVLLYSPNDDATKKQIAELVGIIYDKVVEIIKGRQYPRKRVSPSTKWNNNGCRYGRGKKDG